MATNLDDIQAKISAESDTGGVDEAKSALEGFGDSLKTVGEIAAGIGLEKLAEQFIDFGKSVFDESLKAAGQLQNIKIAFDTAFGGESGGMLQSLNDLSYKTPFLNDQLDKFALKLKDSGVSAQNITPFLKSAGDIAAGTGTDFQSMTGILEGLDNAYSLATVRGSVNSRMLLSIARDGIPIYQAVADVMNTTSKGVHYSADEIAKGGKDLKVTADVFKQAVENLGSGKYLGDAQKQAQTYTGTLKDMQEKFVDIGRTILGVADTGEILKNGLFDKIATRSKVMFDFLGAHTKEIEKFGNAAIKVFDWLADHGDAVAAVLIGIGTAITVAMIPAIISGAVAFGALTIAALPWIALGAAVAGAAYLIITHWSGIVGIFKAIGQWIGNAAQAVDNFIGKFSKVGSVMHSLHIPGFADGVQNFGGGLAMVGERGPELMYLPTGSNIYPNNSRQTNINMNNTINSPADFSSVAREIGWRVNGR